MLRKNPTGVQTKDLGLRPNWGEKNRKEPGCIFQPLGGRTETQLLISKMGEPLLTSSHCVQIFMEIPLSPGKLRMNSAGLMSGVSFSLWVRAKEDPFGNVSPDPEADQ